MHSFFTDPPVNGRARLSQEDARHVRKSLRMRLQEPLVVVYGGMRYQATLVEDEQGLAAQVLGPLEDNEPITRVTLYQGLPKGDKMDLIVRKCTEIGVARVVPCLFARCVARWEGSQKKLARWQRIAREAAVQCGRGQVPQVADCLSFEQLRVALLQHHQALIPWEQGGRPVSKVYQGARDMALVIGPEGGIDPEEAQALQAVPVTLGPRILRTETAGLAALTMVLALAGDME